MTTTDKEKAKARTKMLANLRKLHRDSVKEAQVLLKEQQSKRKAISRAMQGAPKSVPQIAEASGIPAHEVLYYVAAMKKYGDVVEAGLDENYEYYLYRLEPEVKS
jgi:predicted Rossmann fold nucleotide-binding protein DprA/Smf involved in DNA uptake